jgi:hypothetical protein
MNCKTYMASGGRTIVNCALKKCRRRGRGLLKETIHAFAWGKYMYFSTTVGHTTREKASVTYELLNIHKRSAMSEVFHCSGVNRKWDQSRSSTVLGPACAIVTSTNKTKADRALVSPLGSVVYKTELGQNSSPCSSVLPRVIPPLLYVHICIICRTNNKPVSGCSSTETYPHRIATIPTITCSRDYTGHWPRACLNAYFACLLASSFKLWPWKLVPYTRQSWTRSEDWTSWPSCSWLFYSTLLMFPRYVGSRFKLLPRLRSSHAERFTLASTTREAHVPCKPGLRKNVHTVHRSRVDPCGV